MTPADETAIAVLAWIANEPDLLGRFLALTGTDPRRSAVPLPIRVFWPACSTSSWTTNRP